MFYLRQKHAYRDEADENGEAGGGSPEGEGAGGEGNSQTEGESQTQAVAPEIEAEARKMGWTPKEEFKGDPEKWRSADEFVERGRNMLPILRKTVEKQQNELAELKNSIKEFAEYHSKTEQRAYAKAYGDLKAQQMEAVAAGNTEAFKQIDQEIEDLHKEVSSKKPITVPKDDDPADDPVYMDWASRNKWVDTDPEMSAYAEGQGLYLNKTRKMSDGTPLRGIELLEEVTKAVKAKFPEKFSNPRRNSAPSVEGATAVAKKGGKSYADMPKEDRETCDRMVKRYGISKDEFVRTYFEGE